MRLSADSLFWFILLGFVVAASYFTVGVSVFKRELRSSAEVRIASGQKVTVLKVVDGDEISVKAGDQRFVVRMLGIVSFDPNVNDPQIKGAAEMTVNYLRNKLLDGEVELVFDTFARDRNDRILSYVHKGAVDIGEEMLSNGLTIVYTKYPFSRIKRYLATERLAREVKIGLWANPVLLRRSQELKKLWEKEKP